MSDVVWSYGCSCIGAAMWLISLMMVKVVKQWWCYNYDENGGSGHGVMMVVVMTLQKTISFTCP